MLPHGITGPRTKVHDIQGTSFDWPNPQCFQISSLSDKKCEIPLLKNFAPGKVGQSSPQISRFVTNQQTVHEFLQTLCVNFGSSLLRFRDIAGFVQQMSLLHISPRLLPIIWSCSPELCRRAVYFSEPGPVLTSRDVLFSENINLFNPSSRK